MEALKNIPLRQDKNQHWSSSFYQAVQEMVEFQARIIDLHVYHQSYDFSKVRQKEIRALEGCLLHIKRKAEIFWNSVNNFSAKTILDLIVHTNADRTVLLLLVEYFGAKKMNDKYYAEDTAERAWNVSSKATDHRMIDSVSNLIREPCGNPIPISKKPPILKVCTAVGLNPTLR